MNKGTATICLVAATALFFTNPSTDEYVSWVRQSVVQTNPGLMAALFSVVAGPFVSSSTRRVDFGFFSIYTTQIDARTSFATIGVFHSFIPLPQQNHTWAPGTTDAAYPHVVASQADGQWLPEDGYEWVVPPPNGGDLRVQWVPGRASALHPHAVAAREEEHWLPASGYSWAIDPPPPGDFRVRWVPGQRLSSNPHVLASTSEGRWLPEDGYSWIIDPPVSEKTHVQWTPGQRSRLHPHVVAALAEDRWLPEEGFRWMSDPPVSGNFEVRPITVWVLTDNQKRAGCSYAQGRLLCPGPGTGLCWAKGHDPYLDQPPLAIDVGNDPRVVTFGHPEQCILSNN